MTDFRTHGYDIAFEISEAMVSGFLGGALPGVLSGQSGEIDDELASGNFGFADPASAAGVNLDAPGEDTAYLEIPFRFSAAFDTPEEWPESIDITGQVRILTPVIAFESTTTTSQLAFDFSGLDIGDVEITSHDPISDAWTPYIEPLIGLIERIARRSLVAQNRYAVPLPLTIDPGNDGSDPFTPRRMDIRVIRDGTIRSIVLLFPTSPHTVGVSDEVTETVLDPTWNSACIIGNEMLLRRIVGAALLEGMGIYNPSAPDPIITLNGLLDYADNHATLSSSVDIRGMVDEWWASRADLTDLDIRIDDSENLDVSARILAGGPLISAVTTLHMRAEVDVTNPTQYVLHWHVDEPEVVVMPEPFALVILGPLALIITTLKGVATEFIFGALENILTSDCSLVGLTEWPEEPQPVDIDCIFTFPSPIPFFVDDIILDDWAMVGSVSLPDTTYTWPEPSVEIIGDWLVVDGEFGGGTSRSVSAGVIATCFTHYKQYAGSFRAMPAGPVIYPVDYEWCLSGQALRGSGSLHLGEATVSYVANGDSLTLSLGLGDSLHSELCVSAIDSRDAELFAQRAFSIEGEEQYCSFDGVERLEGPPAELNQVGAYVEGLPLIEGYTAAPDEISRGEYDALMRRALVKGMGVDLNDPSVRRP